MSFRHTYITNYLYKSGLPQELSDIETILNEYGTVEWAGSKNYPNEYGYFHGIIKDLDSIETKNKEQEIVDKLKELGVDIKIAFE